MAVIPIPEPDPESDPELADSLDLVRWAQNGELWAFCELFSRYYPRVLPIVRNRLNAQLRAEMESGDVLHEALLNAIKSFARFEVRTHRELEGWFAKLVENYLISAARSAHAQKRDRDLEVPLEAVKAHMEETSPGTQPADRGEGPLEQLRRQEQNQIYLDSVAELEPEQREVVQLRLGQGRPWAEIAASTGRSPDAARMLFTRALFDLRKILRKRGLDSND